MKFKGLAAVTALCVGTAFFQLWNGLAQAKGPLQQIKTYQIYYAEPTASALASLRKYGMAVIEPQHYTSVQIAALKKAGTLPAAYLSVMESPAWNRIRMDQLKPGHFLLRNGARVHFKAWDSYLMDLRQPAYRKVLLDEIGLMVDKGFPVLFLDTVGDIDEYIPDRLTREQMRKAYVTFLGEIHTRFAGLSLIQNRAFDSLPLAAPYIQGFLWEDWRGEWRQDEWTAKRVELVRQYQSKGLAVFAVSSRSKAGDAKEAAKLQFIHLETSSSYDKMK
ncbi:MULTISPECIES: endo alpha-1,4 polygalactosaminidase [Paenibacillus]|uniref:endo alpha-1,4 polygalactosaminidase n=1 Tax=Paenibacillus TaxID=44249 RepID=UPI0022B8DE70|nr:endo alpha-1,4 polygalactosaminidase [Paenibacillus caseinilyticus]MCZ8519007.1 endo alpha-1,4 polygalactosaminidase [Paenibacillus caseinilyticus]